MPRRTPRVLVASIALALVAAACGVADRNIPAVVPLTSQQTVIFAADGTEITRLEADENREVVPLSRIPAIMQNAVIAIEDERFWEHNGVDLRGIARAAKSNTESGGVSEGGSTITQQYIKTVLLSPQRTLDRKIEEANLALQLEETHSKTYILEQYLNTIFFGNRAYGAQMASMRYFGHDVSTLSLAEAALLAGLIAAPSRFDPYRNAELATNRRELVLNQMLKLGYITESQLEEALATPVETQIIPREAQQAQSKYAAPHFVEEVKRFVRNDPRFGETPAERNDLLTNGGLRIYTTVDLAMQQKMEDSANERYNDQGRSDPDLGMVAIDPRTGYVKAMYGGYDYFDTDPAHSYAQVNLAVGTGRATGSTFKAITLAAALGNGIGIKTTFKSPSKTTVKIPGFAEWSVGGGHGPSNSTLSDCAIYSSNTCFANVTADERVLPTGVAEYAAKMGLDTSDDWQAVPAATLGANNNTVLEMTGAYDTFANRGVFVPPTMVTKVVRADGTVLFQHTHVQSKVLEPGQADDINAALEGVLKKGTAKGRGIDRPAAGKTGTTDSKTDAWFIGYTPDLVTGVWVGYSQPAATKRGEIGRLRPLSGYGADMAAPVWQSFMKKALEGVPPTPFAKGTAADDKGSDEATETTEPTTTTSTIPPGNTAIFEVTSNPTMVSMPTLTGGNTNGASSKVKKAGLKLRRIDASREGALPGTVLAQSPAPGSKVPTGSEVVIEATPGNPPPTVPLPDVTGRVSADAVANMKKTGWTVTEIVQPAPAEFLLPSGLPPAPGQIWQLSPAVGTVTRDGKVTVYVQP